MAIASLEDLEAITDGDRKTMLSNMSTIMFYRVRKAPAVAPFFDAHLGANAVAAEQEDAQKRGYTDLGPDRDFYHRLAVTLACRSITGIGDHGFNRTVDASRVSNYLAQLLGSRQARAESDRIYDQLFAVQRGPNRSRMAFYTDKSAADWARKLQELVVKPDYLKGVDLEAAGNPEAARRRLSAQLYKLSKLDPSRVEPVRSAWARQPAGSAAQLAAADRDFPGNFCAPVFAAYSHTDGPIKRAALVTRRKDARTPSEHCHFWTLYYGEELAGFISTHAVPLGLTTGQGHDAQDDKYSCG